MNSKNARNFSGKYALTLTVRQGFQVAAGMGC
jgi:hypothetical protein